MAFSHLKEKEKKRRKDNFPLRATVENKNYKTWNWKSLSHVWLFATPWTLQSLEFSRLEYWSGWPFPSPGDVPFSRESSQARDRTQVSHTASDSLPAESWGKLKNTGVAYPFSSISSRPRNWTRVSWIAGGFFTNWATREVPLVPSQTEDLQM